MAARTMADEGPDLTSVRSAKDFGQALEAVMRRAQLTRKDLAKATKIPYTTLSEYLRGEHLPQEAWRGRLVLILKVCKVTDEARVKEWIDTYYALRRSPGRRSKSVPPPYPGLVGFQPKDAEWFFGRDHLTSVLLDRVTRLSTTGGLLAVIGPSGSGKSSLLGAGLVARLHGTRVRGTRRKYCCVSFTPGERPHDEFVARLGELSRARQHDRAPARRRSPAAGSSSQLVVVIDQFERVLTCDDESQRLALVDSLIGIGTTQTVDHERGLADLSHAVVVLGLRSDFYDVAFHAGLESTLQEAQVVGRMTEAELRQAIVEPARKVKVEPDPELVERVLRDLAPLSGGDGPAAHDAGSLPHLSHALRSAWERGRGARLTVKDYLASGGIDGAVAKTAEAVYNELTLTQKDIAQQIFVCLVHIADDTADTRRRVHRSELLTERADLAHAEVGPVLERFIDRRLITADGDTVEIAHDALLKAWPLLRSWVDAGRAERLVRRQLKFFARLWDRDGRDPSGLYAGPRLGAARSWVDDPALRAQLEPLERSFLEASIARELAEQEQEEQRVQQERERERAEQGKARRRARASVVVSVVLGMLLIALGRVTVSYNQQRQSALKQGSLALSRLVAAEAAALRDNDISLSMQLSLAAYHIAPTREAVSSLLGAAAVRQATRLIGSEGIMQSVAVTRDESLLAAGSADGTVMLWRLSSGTPIRMGSPVQASSEEIFSVAFSPDGHTLATGGKDKVVRLWDVGSAIGPKPRKELAAVGGTVYSVAFSSDGRTLAAGSSDAKIWLWDLAVPSEPRALPALTGHKDSVNAVAFSPVRRMLASGGDDAAVLLWSLDKAQPVLIKRLDDGMGAVSAVSFSPNGTVLAAGGIDKKVHLWNVSSATMPTSMGAPLTGPDKAIATVTFDADGRTLAAGGADSAVHVWDLSTRHMVATLRHPKPVTAVVYVGARHTIATADADGLVRLWAEPTRTPYLLEADNQVYAAAFNRDGRVLATGGLDGAVTFWDVGDPTDPTLVAKKSIHAKSFVGAIAFSPNDSVLAVGTGDGEVQIWDSTDVSRPVWRRSLKIPAANISNRPIESIAFSPDGRTLAVGGRDFRVRLWDVSNGRKLSERIKHGNYVMSVAFSEDGETLATGSVDRTVRLWDVRDRARPVLQGGPLTGPPSDINAVALSSARHLLAAGSSNSKIRLWTIEDPAHPILIGSPLTGPNGYVTSLRFSSDGQTLVAGNSDHKVWLWNVANPTRPKVVAALEGPTDYVYTAAFNSERGIIAAASGDHAIHLFDISVGRAANEVCAIAGEPLTRDEWQQYIPGPPYDPPCV